MAPALPTLTVATPKRAVPFAPGRTRTPAVAGLRATRATTSGTGPVSAENCRVFTPGKSGAANPFAHWKPSGTAVGGVAVVGVSAKTKLWLDPGGMSAGVFGVPVTALVVAFVVWYVKPAARGVTRETPQPGAGVSFGFTIVANAVAGAPTVTERLDGNTAATGEDRASRCAVPPRPTTYSSPAWSSPNEEMLSVVSSSTVGVFPTSLKISPLQKSPKMYVPAPKVPREPR